MALPRPPLGTCLTLFVALTLLALLLSAFALGRQRALACTGPSGTALHSRPHYHGHYVAIWCAAPAFAVLLLGSVIEPLVVEQMLSASAPRAVVSAGDEAVAEWIRDVGRLAIGDPIGREPDGETRSAVERIIAWDRNAEWMRWAAVFVAGVAGLLLASRRIEASLRARAFVESTVRKVLMASAAAAILVTIGIVLSLIFESARFFSLVPWSEFLFGIQWSPQTALRADQVGSSGAFGAVPVFAGTLLITFIAMSVAVPIGLFSAIYLSEYAGTAVRAVVKPLLEILAGVPTVVYGFFAALTVAPWIRGLGGEIGVGISSESAMAAGLVMGIMIIPFVSSLSDDVINAVPAALREGSLGLGATRSETIRRVVLPAALPGIVGSVLLAISRAIGETMIVVMAAGLAANLTANPFEAVTTVTVQIVTLLVGDQEFDSAKTLAAFALGLTLFAVTLVLNVIALSVVRRYREQYD